MRKLIIAAIVFVLVGCTQPDNASRILRDAGYTDIAITGYDFLACSEDDTFHTGFEAKSASGARVAGVVCAGLFFKGATIRLH